MIDNDSNPSNMVTQKLQETLSEQHPQQSQLRPGMTTGQYQLIRELGRGGVGTVYLARDIRLGRRVAIKFLNRDIPAKRAQLLTEARITAQCKHANIVDIYDVGETPEHFYLVLEFLQGITLRTWLKQRWQLGEPGPDDSGVSPSVALSITIPIVRALVHAHRLGLVHRDLKPENIMVTEDGSIKVLDFGTAKLMDIGHDEPCERRSEPYRRLLHARRGAHTPQTSDSEARSARKLVGTMPYMSPEQWGFGEVDARSDIWAIGIILWELCTGRHPLAPLSYDRLISLAELNAPLPPIADAYPDLGRLSDIIDNCLQKSLNQRLPSAEALLEALERLHEQYEATTSRGAFNKPYVGLVAFQRADTHRFFGREDDIASVMARLHHQCIVTIAGVSGAGKSSFVRAGLLPAVEHAEQSVQSFIIRPGREPLAALADLLVIVSRDPTVLDAASRRASIATLRAQPGYLGAVLRARCQEQKKRILLFVDQFEELYALGCEDTERAAFVACLEGMADDVSSPLRVVLTVRSDFLDRMAEDRAFTRQSLEGLTLLPPLSRERLRDALTKPLEAVGYAFESVAMLEMILDSLQTTNAPLPLLQFTSALLWDDRDTTTSTLTLKSYEDLGGIEGALAIRADMVLAGLLEDEQQLARIALTRLVSDERTRAIVSTEELCASIVDYTDDAVERVIAYLVEARLLLSGTAGRHGVTVELAHESLITKWPTFVHWLEQDQEALRFGRRLRVAAAEWRREGYTRDLLWRGQAAQEAERWMDSDALASIGLTADERRYLQAVATLSRRARRQRQWLTIVGITLTLAVGVVVIVLAVLAARSADEARKQAIRADEKATQAEVSAVQARNASRMAGAGQHLSDPTLVLSLIREMEPAEKMPPRWRELARWAMHRDIARAILHHPDVVHSVAFSPDGTRLATASGDKLVRVWRADGTGEPLVLRGHEGRLHAVSFSPDGTRIATASNDATVRIWRADGAGTPVVLRGHNKSVFSVEFSPDSARIVTASSDSTARVWHGDGTGAILVLHGHRETVSAATFSPDGTRIATASDDHTARVWSTADGTPVTVFTGHRDRVYSVMFSPSGARIATASWDKTAQIWNADGTGEPVVLQGRQERVYDASFSPDGRRVVTASSDKIVRIWNVDGTGRPERLLGHQDVVVATTFSPSGNRVATASLDKTVRVWSIPRDNRPIELRGHEARVYSASFSPDGARIVTASRDRTARVWRIDGEGIPVQYTGHEDSVYSASFGPQGARIVTASWDGTARIWYTDDMRPPIIFSGHKKGVYSASFSPDGARIVTASWDGTARVWNADGTGTPVILEGHRDGVYSAAFSPDGRQIVTASRDNTAIVWNADGAGSRLILKGHREQVYSATFSPSGNRVITTSDDKTARIWYLNRPRADGSVEYLTLSGHESVLGASGARAGYGAFSPDGSRVLTISDDKTLRVWHLNDPEQPALLRISDLDAYSAAYSPDGTRIVTASHPSRNPLTQTMEHIVTIWPSFERLSGLNDPALWAITSYCPPVAMRASLLGIPQTLAEARFRRCQERVRSLGRTPGSIQPAAW